MRWVVLVLLSVILSAAKDPRDPIPWSWERRDDLRFIGEAHTVAFYAGIITLTRDAVVVFPRRNPLLLAKQTHRIAVVRIETDHPRIAKWAKETPYWYRSGY